MQKITPCLWFNDNAEEAVNFYMSVFKGSKITSVSHYGEASAAASGRPRGSIMTVVFELGGQEFMALNGGPHFTFSPAISLMVYCDTQGELDEFWNKLSAGGATQECGWLTDKYGVSWQIIPAALGEMMKGGDAQKLENVMKALLKMEKLDVDALKRAYEQP